MPCYVCPEGQVLACPGCGHDIHSHSVSSGCGLCVAQWKPGQLLADLCILAPPFMGSQAPRIVKEREN